MNPCILTLHGKRNEGELLQIAAPIDSNGGRRLSDVFVQLLTQNRPAFAPASIGGVVQEQDIGFSLPSASNQVVILQKATQWGALCSQNPGAFCLQRQQYWSRSPGYTVCSARQQAPKDSIWTIWIGTISVLVFLYCATLVAVQ